MKEPTLDDLLDEVRGLASALALLDRALPMAVKRAHDAGVEATRLADAIGVHRATLYRRFLPPEGKP